MYVRDERRGGRVLPREEERSYRPDPITGVCPREEEGGWGVAERRGEIIPMRPDHRCMSERRGGGVRCCWEEKEGGRLLPRGEERYYR